MNTDKTSKKSFAFLLTAIITALVFVAFRTVNFIFFFDGDVGYYRQGAILPIIFNILLLAAAIFFILFSLLKLRGKRIVYADPSKGDKVIAIVSAAVCVALAVTDLISAVNGEVTGLLLMLLSLLSGVYFIFDLLKFKKSARLELSILFLIRVTLMLATSYFDRQVQMNAPDKILFGLACLSAMFFIVNEMRVLVGTARSATYYLFAALTVVLCATSAIPSVIAFHAGLLPDTNGLYFEYYLLLTIAVYCVARILSVKRAELAEAVSAAMEASEPEDTANDAEEVETTDDISVGAETNEPAADNTDTEDDTADDTADDTDADDAAPAGDGGADDETVDKKDET